MSWANSYIASLASGETVSFRPKGNSMKGKVESGQLVTVAPPPEVLSEGMIVLCKVNGHQYLHLISAIGQDGRVQISNASGHVNGWCTKSNVFGVVTKVES